MARTDISDRKLKDAVRDPQPEADAHQVATRMLCWDADLSACVDGRQYVIDEHDRLEAPKQLVSLPPVYKRFGPAIETLDAAAEASGNAYSSATLRRSFTDHWATLLTKLQEMLHRTSGAQGLLKSMQTRCRVPGIPGALDL